MVNHYKGKMDNAQDFYQYLAVMTRKLQGWSLIACGLAVCIQMNWGK